MSDSLFTGEYKVAFRTWQSDGETACYAFGDHWVVHVSILHSGSGLWNYERDPTRFGKELRFELHDNELCLIDIPPHGAYFTAWYERY